PSDGGAHHIWFPSWRGSSFPSTGEPLTGMNLVVRGAYPVCVEPHKLYVWRPLFHPSAALPKMSRLLCPESRAGSAKVQNSYRRRSCGSPAALETRRGGNLTRNPRVLGWDRRFRRLHAFAAGRRRNGHSDAEDGWPPRNEANQEISS